MSFTINQFDIDTLIRNPAICMIGRRGTDKSKTIQSILEDRGIIPDLVFDPTEKLHSFYSSFVPQKNIVVSGSFERLNRLLLDAQSDVRRGIKKNRFVVFDNVMMNKVTKNKAVNDLLLNSHNYNIGYILSVQTPLGVKPSIRNKLDYVFLLADESVHDKKKLFDNYGGMFPSYASFEAVFTACTADKGSMVIDNVVCTNEVAGKIFWHTSTVVKRICVTLNNLSEDFVSDSESESESESEFEDNASLNESVTSYELLEYNLNNIVRNPTICMIGRRGTGKSFAIRSILKTKNIVPDLVIAPADKLTHFYSTFVPQENIVYEYTESVIQKILDDAAKDINNKIKRDRFIVLDDCLASSCNWQKSNALLELTMNGRHYRIGYILTMQTSLGIAPNLRLNMDYVMLLKEDSMMNKKKLYDHYASMFPTFKAFETVFDKYTMDYSMMLIDNRCHIDNILQKVYWYKASENPIIEPIESIPEQIEEPIESDTEAVTEPITEVVAEPVPEVVVPAPVPVSFFWRMFGY